MPQDKLPEPGEFTRIFKRQRLGAHGGAEPEKQPGEASGIQAEAAADAEPDAASHAFPPPAAPPHPVPLGGHTEQKSGEPGEFTQYFMGGLPSKVTPSGAPTNAHRTPTGVQRPNTPVPPPRTLNGDSSSGNFTERFAPPRQNAPVLKTEQYGVYNPQMGPAPDLSKSSLPDHGGSFDFSKPASQKEQPGEYTSLFGRGDVPPPPRQSAVSPSPAAPMMSDSPNSFSARPLRDVAPEAPKGPSEFTVIAQGRQAPQATGGPALDSPSVTKSAAGTKRLPVNINVNPINPMAALPVGTGGMGLHMPHASGNIATSGANISTPIGSAGLHAPPVPQLNVSAAGAGASKLSDHAKLIIFFGVLAILAIILVVVVVAKN